MDLKQAEPLPVNLEKAEFILSLSNKKSAFKSMMLILREIEDQFKLRQKLNNSFYQTSNIIEQEYSSKILTSKQLLSKVEYDIGQQERYLDQLHNRRTSLKLDLDAFENELSETREYAEQRRNKKSKREKQYHQLYNIPIVAQQYKKKYVRARDKNLDAEEQVSNVRSKVDGCQQEITNVSKSVVDIQKEREQFVLEYQELEFQLHNEQQLVFELQEGRKFIQSFNQHQLVTAQKATNQFIESIQAMARNNNSKLSLDTNQDFIKYFKLALYEYGEAENFINTRWGQLQVDFGCSKCKLPQVGWPKLDKVRVNELLCDACYQDHHTSMVFEKKLSGIKDKSYQLLSLPGSSMLSFSSASTVQSDSSNQSSNGDKKKGIKKMMNIFKRSSSSGSFSTTSSDYNTQRNNMMTT